MNQTFDRKWLIYAMKTANSAVNKRSPKPILTKLLLAAGDGQASVHGTDTEMSVTVTTTCEHSVPARVVLPQQALQFLDSSDTEQATIESEDSKVTVKCGRSKVTLNTEDPLEFPYKGFESPEDVTKLDGKAFQTGLKQTVYACDADSSRFALGGVFLQDSAEGLICVGTDGRRLSRSIVEAIAVGGLGGVILPERVAKAICSMNLEEVHLWTDASNIYMQDDSVSLSCRMVEGRYPNWKMVIPNRVGSVAVANAEQMLRMVKQGSVVADFETKGMLFSFDQGTLSVAASAAEVGSSNVSMPVEYDGEPIQIRADYSYVLDWLERARETVKINIESPTTPIVLTEGSYLGVVMPMALEQ